LFVQIYEKKQIKDSGERKGLPEQARTAKRQAARGEERSLILW
jgi:hypothetical protein